MEIQLKNSLKKVLMMTFQPLYIQDDPFPLKNNFWATGYLQVVYEIKPLNFQTTHVSVINLIGTRY